MKTFNPRRAACATMMAIAAVPALLAMSLGAVAAYPEKPVQFIVSVGPGGGTDLIGRQVAKQLSEIWGKPVIVENKPGAAGIIAAEAVFKSAPDGYTLFMSHGSVVVATPTLYKRPDYDPVKQLAPITQIGSAPLLVIVHSSVPVKNIPELVAYMKQKNAKNESFGFATSALGSADHLSGEEFKMAAGVDMLVVPYKNALPAFSDVLAGHVPFGFFAPATVASHLKSGAVRPVGFTSNKRSALLPDVQTVAETYPGFIGGPWYGLWAPAGTPPAIVEKISSDVKRVIASAEMQTYLTSNGFEGVGSTPAEFAEFIRTETLKTVQVIKAANVKVD